MKKVFPSFVSKQPGFVILFAIIISTIVMVIGFGIFSISFKEALLSSTSRESMKAFYAADSGAECALYMATTGIIDAGGVVSCGTTATPATISAIGSIPVDFFIEFATSKTCAHITVTRSVSGSGTTETHIFSQGYNRCVGPNPERGNPLLVERVLDVLY